jgi:hypothetical protein
MKYVEMSREKREGTLLDILIDSKRALCATEIVDVLREEYNLETSWRTITFDMFKLVVKGKAVGIEKVSEKSHPTLYFEEA